MDTFQAIGLPYAKPYVNLTPSLRQINWTATSLRQTLRQPYAQLTPTLKIKVLRLGCAILRQPYAQLTPNQLDCKQLTPNLTPTLRPAYADLKNKGFAPC